MKLALILLSLIFCQISFAQTVPRQKMYALGKVIENYLLHGGRTFLETLMLDRDLDTYNSFIKNTPLNLQDKSSHQNSCAEVCPESMEILNLNSKNYTQKESNSLSFLNQPKYFEDIMKYEYGFCWGHAHLTTQLRYLAFFDPENSQHTTTFTKNSKEWRQLILTNLKDITEDKPKVFPYIKSIRELSELFTLDLKKLVIHNWAQNALSIQNYLNTFKNKNVYSKDELQNIVNELQLRLTLGQEPELLFSIWGSDRWIHVVLVKKISYDDYSQSYTLYLDDNKQFNNISTMLEPSTIVINLSDSTITYPKGEVVAPDIRIGRIELPKSNYYMYNKILPRLVKFCRAQTKCQL